jgi:maltose O-acetyltransferase
MSKKTGIFRLIRRSYRGLSARIESGLVRLRYRIFLLKGFDLGPEVAFGKDISMEGNIKIGAMTALVGHTTIVGNVSIGKNVVIAANCTILGINHDFNKPDCLPYGTSYLIRQITIDDNVWIGTHVCITPGVHIGEGAIIGMGSIVTGEIPACAIAAGNPAKVIKYRDVDRYQRLVTERKFMSKIRRNAPHRSRDIKMNKPLFDKAIREKGFMLNIEIKTDDLEWRSAILYQLAKNASIPFGNAEKHHIAVRTELLENREKTAHEVAQVILAIDSSIGVDEQVICTDLEELINSLSNPDRQMSRK